MRGRMLAAALVVGVAFVVGCGGTPGSEGGASEAPENVSTDISKVEPMTLTVWTFESSREALLKQAGEMFTAKYPNIKVRVNLRDFSAYPGQVKLALSSEKAPDVVQGNLGWTLDGPLLQAGLIIDPTKYNEEYGWSDRFPEEGRRILEFTPDGKTYGSGTLVGIAYTADVIGFFYNKKKLADLGLELPKTMGELEAAMDAAKAAGETPLMMGNGDGTMALHTYFNLSNQMASPDIVRGLVYGEEDASFTDSGMVDAAAKVKEWFDKGYMPKGTNGVGTDDAVARFVKGEGVFMSTGSWYAPTIGEGLKDDAGFFLPPPVNEGDPSNATGSFGAAFEISANGKNPDVAAAFLDFLASQEVGRVVAEAGDLPSFPLDQEVDPRYGVDAEIQQAFEQVNEADGLIPYLDAATPTMGGDVLWPGTQDLIAGKIDAAGLMEKAQGDRETFLEKQK